MANKKKNVAFFGIKYFPSRGGTSRVAENLIYNLKESYNITIYCYKNDFAKNHISGVNVVEYPEFRLGGIGVFLYFLRCYFHIRFFGNYDIIHAHKIDSFFFLGRFSKKSNVIATAHEAPYKRDKWGKLAKIFFKYCEKRFIDFDGIKTAISKPLCEFYRQKHEIDVKFIPNGINLFELSSKNSIDDFWPESVPKTSGYVFFAARRIMGTKGLHTMLKAFKKIDYKGNIFIAGELDNYPAYIKQVKELSQGLNVYFLGYVNPLPTLLEFVRKSQYFVFPSETEGMSIMLLEVASTGKSILASDIPENTQVFDDKDVIFFKNKDEDDLAKKLIWIENNMPLFQSMGKVAKNKVTSRYTWDRISLIYKDLYDLI
ncbi:glycosyltransferase family 4 protein [Pareuzebyella sediminis]|uniref:glycosyltransferase family 4 protein n=1 Tax=Pareuzebyella sediminis TaxID=2607998 RepID=UPI0011EF19D5|nr:glycosyltransferase family 4 protein [Pareuzebyella sediminis]